MRRYLILLPVLALLAGCGGTKTVTQTVTSTTTATPPPTKTVQPVPCPPGNSFAGCSVVGQPSTGRLRLSPVPGPEFPDVSNWQGPITPSGHSAGVDWSQVKAWQQGHGWAPGGAFKLGEFGVDPDASINNGKLKALGMWRTGYWFVRDTGCQHEAGQIIAEAKTLGLTYVWLDAEVPEARGYTTCLVPAVRAAGLGVGIYTGPGTWPGGSTFGVPLWDAAYNFSGPQFGGLWTGRAAAWQFTDGVFASKTFVPGIGFDDVNVDLNGFAALAGSKPAPARLVCWGPHAQVKNATCKKVRGEVGHWSRARDASKRVYTRRGCAVLAQRKAWFASELRKHPKTKAAKRRAALRASRRAYAGRSCGVFAQRATYFENRVKQAMREF